MSLRRQVPQQELPLLVLTSVTQPNPSENQESAVTSEEKEPTRKNGFLSSTFDELKLVVWPSRQQLFSESIAVILMVTLSAAAIAAVSRFYGWVASQIFP